jgi:tetratricopeptide (TPR) repeat protein
MRPPKRQREFAEDRPRDQQSTHPQMCDDRFAGDVLGRIHDVTGFVQAWSLTRPRLYLLRSWPAVTCLGIVVMIVISAMLVPKNRLVPRYKKAAQAALRNNETGPAETMLRKVLAIDPEDHESRYGLALIAFEKSDRERAFELMRKLALETQYGPAHFWLASQLGELSKRRSLNQRERTLLGFHLRQASIHDPHNQEANFLMGHYSYKSGQYGDAVRFFGRAVVDYPESRLMWHDALRALSKIDDAEKVILDAEKFFRVQASRRPTDVKNRLLWAQTLTMRDDRSGATKILEEGVVLQPSNVDYRRALTAIYLEGSDHLLARSQHGEGISRLRRAAMLSPESEQVHERLYRNAISLGVPRTAARAILEELQSIFRPSAELHRTLARIALADEDMREASVNFRRASKLDPDDFRSANNLAWTLARLDPPQLDEALQIAEMAAELTAGLNEDHLAVINTHQDIVNRMSGQSLDVIAQGSNKSVVR